MEEKKITKISLSTFFLILAIIAIVVMGVVIYKLNNEKTVEVQKTTELQAQVNSLNGTISDLKGKITTISEIINSNTSKENTTLSNEATNTNTTNNSSVTNEVSNSKTKEKDYRDIILNGRYAIPNTDSGWEFTKDGRAYSCGNMNVMKGTYRTTEKDSVEIHYTENKVWDEVTGKESVEKINKYDYIFVDNNENIYWKDENNEKVKLEKYDDTTPNAY